MYIEEPATIKNCKFNFECPGDWDDLEPTGNQAVRFCGTCDKGVYLAEDLEALAVLAAAGKCAAFAGPANIFEDQERDIFGLDPLFAPYRPRNRCLFRTQMNGLIIRMANVNDAQMLSALAYTTFWDAFASHPKNAPEDMRHYMRQAFSEEQIALELADGNTFFLIAELDEKAAGYAKVVRDATEEGITAERPIELARLYSHQEYLGKGVGQNLMNACVEFAQETHHDVIWLGVWEYNPRAMAFYEKNGFRAVGKHIFQLGSDPQTDLLMQRDV